MVVFKERVIGSRRIQEPSFAAPFKALDRQLQSSTSGPPELEVESCVVADGIDISKDLHRHGRDLWKLCIDTRRLKCLRVVAAVVHGLVELDRPVALGHQAQCLPQTCIDLLEKGVRQSTKLS